MYNGADEALHGKTTVQIPGLALDDLFGHVYILREVIFG
jgi:hypothetical protein